MPSQPSPAPFSIVAESLQEQAELLKEQTDGQSYEVAGALHNTLVNKERIDALKANVTDKTNFLAHQIDDNKERIGAVKANVTEKTNYLAHMMDKMKSLFIS